MELKIKITGILDEQEIEFYLRELTLEKMEKIKTDGFNGLDILVYVLTLGSGVTIIQIAKTIRKIVVKNNAKSVVLGNIEIKGYSYKQTKELLKMMQLTDSIGGTSDDSV